MNANVGHICLTSHCVYHWLCLQGGLFLCSHFGWGRRHLVELWLQQTVNDSWNMTGKPNAFHQLFTRTMHINQNHCECASVSQKACEDGHWYWCYIVKDSNVFGASINNWLFCLLFYIYENQITIPQSQRRRLGGVWWRKTEKNSRMR